MINQYKVNDPMLNNYFLYIFLKISIVLIRFIPVKQSEFEVLYPILKKYKIAKDSNRILTISFTTLIEYMWLLRGSSMLLNSEYCLLYLAAAVSDFYIPSNEMVCSLYIQ